MLFLFVNVIGIYFFVYKEYFLNFILVIFINLLEIERVGFVLFSNLLF